MESSRNSKFILKCTSLLQTKLLGPIIYFVNIKYVNTVFIFSSIDHGQFRYIQMKLHLQGQDCSIQEMELLWFMHFVVLILKDGYQTMIHLQKTRSLIRIVNSFLYFKILIIDQQLNTMDYSWKLKIDVTMQFII